MKKYFYILFTVLALTSCSVMIPLQTNLSDQTMLMAENRNIKANYALESRIQDGYIDYISVQKNGRESIDNKSNKYATETAFFKIWNSFFSNKFNHHSNDQMEVHITLVDLYLKQQAITSIGYTIFTGNEKVNIEAVAVFNFFIEYHGKKYEKQIEVSTTDYNESQSMSVGDTYYTTTLTNPTLQKAMLLQDCFNKSIIHFENFIRMVMLDK